ncbi:amidohydrolase [Streptomyces spinoverrucosus]|uniref:amidohydrolase n=1 Tax=Streptomyces spinoverrucosus TaxID=284043 RepID=UPI0018C397A0|nr:amidohydrolase [Streptomyces spinoverrucosus]MBG0857070.1 amidohydrolase [Streptomyces spinoverrucosus]
MEHSQSASSAPDTVYVNGRIWPGLPAHGSPADEVPEYRALAVARGRVVALGDTRELLELAGPDTEVVELGHRTVVPGLIDGHMHAARAGATWSSELHWQGMPRLSHALDSIRAAARNAAADAWVRAIGGWHPCQFEENRPPTQAELDEVAPDRPVYVQALYDVAVLNTRAARIVGLEEWTDLPGGTVERDPDTGRATGVIRGLGAFTRCMAAIPEPSPAEQRISTRTMLTDLNAAGLTGVIDAGGFGMSPERYDALFDLWRTGELTVRMRLYASAVDAGRELDQLDGWLRQSRSRFGDDLLRVLGVGEIIHYGCHDFEGLTPFELGEQSYKELLAITRRVAARGWPMHIHAVLDSTIDRILDAWETVHHETPLDALRFSLAHADTISDRNIRRLKALGAGVVVDDHQVFKGGTSEREWGPGSMESVPPLGDLLEAGVPVGAGTDATRASSYSPWLSLWWLVEGRSLDGAVQRAPRHRLSRARALHLHTRGSAWFSFEESDRGHLFPGALADFAVLSDDYFSVPTAAIPSITSQLTVVGGRTVHESAPS